MGIIKKEFIRKTLFPVAKADSDRLLAQEQLQGERVAWLLRWVIYGLICLLAGTVYLANQGTFALVGVALSGICLIFNALITPFVLQGRVHKWIRYVTATLDVLFLTLYNGWETFTLKPYVPVTSSTLLIYPLIILFSSLRLDRALILFTTALTIAAVNGLYFVARPSMEERVLVQLSSADTWGQVYRSVYLGVCGAVCFFTPVVVRRLLIKQKQLELENLEHMAKAKTDKLTGLANRRELETVLERVIAESTSNGQVFSIFFIDLDGFKPINDRHGHDVGDLVLVEIARRLRTVMRDSDIVARLGGDEFVAVVGRSADKTGLELIAGRLISVVNQPILLHGISHMVGASIGISLWPADGITSEELMHTADQAMYAAKRAGKNTWSFAVAQN